MTEERQQPNQHIKHTRRVISEPGGRVEMTETTEILPSYIRPRITKAGISEAPEGIREDLVDSYNSVEAAILAGLSILSNDEVGAYPLDYGETGSSTTTSPLMALQELEGVYSDREIASIFINNRVKKEYKTDTSVVGRVIFSLNSIKGTSQVRSKK